MSSVSSNKLTIRVQNIANAQRDEIGVPCPITGDIVASPLCTRLTKLCKEINKSQPDVSICIEGGRGSKGQTWSSIAAEIADKTGMEHTATMLSNGTMNPFGKAVFVRKGRAFCSGVKLVPIFETCKKQISDVTIVSLHTVTDSMPCYSETVRVAIVLMPMARDARMIVSKWINLNAKKADVWVGDFNTFHDDGGPEMIEIIKDNRALVHLGPSEPTFRAFKHDLVKLPIERADSPIFGGEVMFRYEEHCYVHFTSTLDHVFIQPHALEAVEVTYEPITPASDHCAILINVQL
jgi:hypothetical protein